MYDRNASVQLQAQAEQDLAEYFEAMVSEWNPCFDEVGNHKFFWDEEVQAHDVSVELPADDPSQVNPACPGRVRLRCVLESVLKTEGDAVDLEPVRRLVAALVQTSGRHTAHWEDAPVIGVHACAQGKPGCPTCRYGYPLDRVPRGQGRRMHLVKGDKEGSWFARFPRNDRLCCCYNVGVLLANLGNIDFRPCLNLWAVVEYVTKYATKAPKGSQRLGEVLRVAVDQVCKYEPEHQGTDLLRRSLQKVFARTLGERDFGIFEAVHLGLRLPLVFP